MSRAAYIYGLIDPTTGELRYVGKTVQNLKDRLSGHMRLADLRGQYSRNWLYGLKQLGISAEIFEIERCEGEQWREAEVFWIAYFKSIGARLTNQTDGGMGPSGCLRSPDTLARMSEAQKGKTLTQEHRQAISRGLLGLPKAQEATDRTAAFHRGRKRSQQTLDAMSAARIANGTTEAQRESLHKLHLKNTGAKRSQETRKRIADAVRLARSKKECT